MSIAIHPVGANQTQVDMGDGVIILYSYDTPVAAKVSFPDGETHYLRTDTFYSRTTSKHINAWLGKDAEEVSQAIINELASK